MKKVFVLALCALFIACSNSSQKDRETAGPDPNTDTMSTARTTVPTPVTADTTGNAASAPATINTPPATAGDTRPGEVVPKPNPDQSGGNADAVKRGEALYASMDCKACHQPKVKVVGPSYEEVAKKYSNTPANVSYLVNKIIKGGAGVWGAVPMSPHPTLSQDDAKALVQYVLSVK
jgi:cytochrome c